METDCRTEEGITVGLIDSLISIARVLAKRDLSSSNVKEALQDLRDDEDVRELFSPAGKNNPFEKLMEPCPECGYKAVRSFNVWKETSCSECGEDWTIPSVDVSWIGVVPLLDGEYPK